MQDVIHRVMEAEGEARKILQDAQGEADRLVGEARSQAKQRADQVRTEVRQAADKLLKEAEQAAEQQKAEQLALAAVQIDSGIRIDDALRRSAVDAVVACVAAAKPPA
jgi:vacuolar-type H+-ATPase subunit H